MPKIIKNEKERTISTAITLKKHLRDALEENLKTKKPKISRSALIEYLIEEYLAKS